MQIDRSRFLLLTASLAGACSSTAPQPAAPEPLAPDDGSRASSRPIVVAAPPEEWAPDETAPPPEPQRIDDEPEDLRPAVNNLARCQSLQPPPGPQCEGFGYVRSQCEAYDRALTPDAADAATDCLLSKSGRTELCTDRIVGHCLVAGLQAVPPRDVPDVDCDSIVNSCGHSSPLTLSSCRKAAAGVKPQHHEDLVACMVESCELEECIYYF